MTQSVDLTERALSFFSGDTLADPYPLFAEMREQCPYLRFGEDWVVVTRHDAVKQAYLDDAHFMSNHFQPGTVEHRHQQTRNGTLALEDQQRMEEVGAFGENLVAQSDGPKHTRRREVFRRAFGARAILELESEVQQLVDDALDRLAEEPEADIVSGLGFPIPRFAHTRLLGIPDGDFGMFEEWTNLSTGYFARGAAEGIRPFHAMLGEFRGYVAELVEGARRRPEKTGHFLRTLVEARDAGEIDDDELAGTYTTVMLTGTETALAVLCSGVVTLLRHRDEWTMLCERPELARAAVEEVLRFEPPLQIAGRNAAPGAVLVNKRIPEGTRVLGVIASANRDASVFVEPDRFWIERPDTHQKLTFAPGSIHQCLGSVLARLEARIVFSSLARRFPDAEVVDDSLSWRRSPVIRLPAALRVDLGRERDRRAEPLATR